MWKTVLEEPKILFFIIEYLRYSTEISRLMNLSPAHVIFFVLGSSSINQWSIARVRYNTRRATFVTCNLRRNGQKIQFAKRPQASSREPMNGRSLIATGKKEVEGKKIVTLFLPRRVKSRSFATRRRGMPECVPSYLVGRKYSFQNDYRLSFSLFFPPATRMTERWVPPLSVTVRNYKGESAFKDWERRRS